MLTNDQWIEIKSKYPKYQQRVIVKGRLFNETFGCTHDAMVITKWRNKGRICVKGKQLWNKQRKKVRVLGGVLTVTHWQPAPEF